MFAETLDKEKRLWNFIATRMQLPVEDIWM